MILHYPTGGLRSTSSKNGDSLPKCAWPQCIREERVGVAKMARLRTPFPILLCAAAAIRYTGPRNASHVRSWGTPQVVSRANGDSQCHEVSFRPSGCFFSRTSLKPDTIGTGRDAKVGIRRVLQPPGEDRREISYCKKWALLGGQPILGPDVIRCTKYIVVHAPDFLPAC
jgi:hypothetical protein